MIGNEPNDATPFLPERRSLKALREAAAGCRGCHLWCKANQTVFGEGAAKARVVLVGEQPGDREDRTGRPRREREGLVRDLRAVAGELSLP